jgi:ribosomal protein L7Ae-like RNA K-turn-binding protein
VLNGVKAGKAKLILLAPDTECSEALDDKVDLVIAEAQSREVPVCYCLSRRRIGKAVGLTMRQSAVCIYDPSGAHDMFKKIVTFVNHSVDTGTNINNPALASQTVPGPSQSADTNPGVGTVSKASLTESSPNL